MPPINWPEVLNLLSPELTLTIFALLVLGLDLVWGKGGDRTAYVALIGLAVTIFAAVRLLGPSQEILFGMMVVDSLAIYFKIIAALTTAFVILSSMEFMKRKTPYRGEFYGLLLLATVAMNLLAAASDLIMIFLALEFVSQTSYVLVGYLRQDYASSEGGLKYLLYGALTTALTLFGMSLLYGATGTTNLREISTALLSGVTPVAEARWILLPALVLTLTGFAFKIGLVPFHQWTPDAYEGAPTPIAAFLSVGPKATGFAVLMRFLWTALPIVFFQVDWQTILAVISIVSMTFGNLVAIQQRNIKRMLAYSSIAQVGYILLGVVALGPGSFGEQGVLLYVLAYLFTNLGAFIAVVAFSYATGSDDIYDYAGLVRRAPILAFSLVVFFMSLAGIPPTGGFLGKLFVFGAVVQQGLYFLAVVGVLNSIVSLYYYFGIVRQMFFLPAKSEQALAIPRSLLFGVAATVALTLLMGFYPQPFIDLAATSAILTGYIP